MEKDLIMLVGYKVKRSQYVIPQLIYLENSWIKFLKIRALISGGLALPFRSDRNWMWYCVLVQNTEDGLYGLQENHAGKGSGNMPF